MSSRPLERYQYTLMKEVEVDGVATWQIEAIPNEKEIDETGYTKAILFVRKDNFIVIRAVNWVKKGKRLKYMQVKKLEQIDGIWVPTELSMVTKKGKRVLHRTTIRMHNVKFNQDLSEDFCTIRQLEKGL